MLAAVFVVVISNRLRKVIECNFNIVIICEIIHKGRKLRLRCIYCPKVRRRLLTRGIFHVTKKGYMFVKETFIPLAHWSLMNIIITSSSIDFNFNLG